MQSRWQLSIAALALGFGLSGCVGQPDDGSFTASLSPQITEPQTSLPSSENLVRRAQQQFTEGNFGSANSDFAKSLEVDSKNPEAWLGLAASYDQIGRFDEADKAYAKVQELIGATASVLNNMGYSYLLRGNHEKARSTFEAAYNLDPGNPYIVNNIEILNKRLTTLGHAPLAMN